MLITYPMIYPTMMNLVNVYISTLPTMKVDHFPLRLSRGFSTNVERAQGFYLPGDQPHLPPLLEWAGHDTPGHLFQRCPSKSHESLWLINVDHNFLMKSAIYCHKMGRNWFTTFNSQILTIFGESLLIHVDPMFSSWKVSSLDAPTGDRTAADREHQQPRGASQLWDDQVVHRSDRGSWYPAWWTYKKPWKMAIEIVDCPINSMVDLSIAM